MTLDFISSDFGIESFTLNTLIAKLYKAGKRGKLEKEWPLVKRENQIVRWRTLEGLQVYTGKDDPFPTHLTESGNAVNYSFSKGRLGDDLVSYLHAKWIAYQYGLPLVFVAFPFSDLFHCHYLEKSQVDFSEPFASRATIRANSQLSAIPNAVSTLFNIPYTPDSYFDYNLNNLQRGRPFFYVDWDDPVFKEEVRRCLQPVDSTEIIELPKDRVTVAMHIRRGGGFDKPDSYKKWPLKFPLMRYYYEQLTRLIEILEGEPLYVHIFTDDLYPEDIIHSLKKEFKKKGDITFGGRIAGNGPANNILDDFYMLTQFDCLIRGDSNFSMTASKLADYKVEISPEDCYWQYNLPVIDKVAIRFGEK